MLSGCRFDWQCLWQLPPPGCSCRTRFPLSRASFKRTCTPAPRCRGRRRRHRCNQVDHQGGWEPRVAAPLTSPLSTSAWVCARSSLSSLGASSSLSSAADTKHAALIRQDGIGAAGRFLVGGRLGREFDDDPRRWRMVAEAITTLGAARQGARGEGRGRASGAFDRQRCVLCCSICAQALADQLTRARCALICSLWALICCAKTNSPAQKSTHPLPRPGA